MMFQQARQRVVDTCLELADQGYLAGTGGNVALRADEAHFLVTPSGTDYYLMTAADICVLRLSDKKQVDGETGPSVEAGLHANVLLARPDCFASVHTHQPIASAYTLLATPLNIQDRDLKAFLGSEIPCVPYAPSGTAWLAKGVGKAFNDDTHACLMRNHGVVCVGVDERQASERVVALEVACANFFRAASQGNPSLESATAALIDQTLSSVSYSSHTEVQL